MADPLSQLRQFHINGREIKECSGYIIFGDHGWPKSVNTNYLVYSTDDDKSKKEYYTLDCLMHFLKNKDVAHHHYVKQAGSLNIPVVHRPDRKNLLAYLNGEQQTSTSIDKSAPIPAVRLSADEIYRLRDQQNAGSASSSQQSSSAKSTTNQSSSNKTDASIAAAGSASSASGASSGPLSGQDAQATAKKRPHDPEMEKKFREEFAARLYEPSNKKLATIIPPTERADRNDESAGTSAAISKQFTAEKLAALRLKHQAVKRTQIIDADMDVGKHGSGTVDATDKDTNLLLAMDSDPFKLIKSKEKVWRTRTSILQAQSKNFAKTVLPMVNLLTKMEDPNRPKNLSQMPSVPTDIQLNQFSQPQQTSISMQQNVQRNAYNRYDQERFIKRDIGVEIDTKKSFVHNTNLRSAAPIGSQLTTTATSLSAPAPTRPIANGNANIMVNHHRQEDTVDSRQQMNVASHRPSKRTSTVPIIIIPATPTSLINMYNAASILQDLTYIDVKPGSKPAESEKLIQRKKPDGTHVFYKLIDNPVRLEREDWARVVAVFVQGQAWQFKGWPLGSPVDIFSKIKGFHLKWDEVKLEKTVDQWNVEVLELSRHRRHLDKAVMLRFWSSLDQYMMKHKSYLKF